MLQINCYLDLVLTSSLTPVSNPTPSSVSRWRSSLSSPSPSSSPGPPLSRVVGVSPIGTPPSAKPCSTPQSSERHGNRTADTQHFWPEVLLYFFTDHTGEDSGVHSALCPLAPSFSSPLHPVLHRTLSPVGKDLSPVAERTPTFLPHPPKRSKQSCLLHCFMLLLSLPSLTSLTYAKSYSNLSTDTNENIND